MIAITDDDIRRAKARLEEEEKQVKKAFFYVKQLDFQKFTKFMNELNSRSYKIAMNINDEALSATLQPKLIAEVKEKRENIQQLWEGINTINVSYAEFDIYDMMQVIHKEMVAAAKDHGESFESYQQAKEAIREEVDEVFEAADRGDLMHAKKEAIQAIGVLIKFVKTVEVV